MAINLVYIWRRQENSNHVVWFCGNNYWSSNGQEAKGLPNDEAQRLAEEFTHEFTDNLVGVSPCKADTWPELRPAPAFYIPGGLEKLPSMREIEEKYVFPAARKAWIKELVDKLTVCQAQAAFDAIKEVEGSDDVIELLKARIERG